jgi:glycine/D-amino acid oxidase-like deaminating enzyme
MQTGVEVEDQDPLLADAVIVAMGPWTSQVSQWIPGLQLGSTTGQKYHSVILRPQQQVSEHCLFTSFKYASGGSIFNTFLPRAP